jgi:hypothetical protein
MALIREKIPILLKNGDFIFFDFILVNAGI